MQLSHSVVSSPGILATDTSGRAGMQGGGVLAGKNGVLGVNQHGQGVFMQECSNQGRGDRVSRSRTAVRRVALAGLTVCALFLAADTAGASAIHRHHLIVVTGEASLGPAWARFLAGGTALWASHRAPRFPSGLVLPTSDGRLVDTPFVDYLLWRRALDPSRFDFYHPNVGPELAELLTPPRITPHVSTAVSKKPHKVHPALVHPAPQSLPEPGTFVIALVLACAGLSCRGRISGRPAPPGR